LILRPVTALAEFGMGHAIRKDSSRCGARLPSRIGKIAQAARTHDGAKSRESEEQSLHIAQAGAQEVATPPKQYFSEPTIPQPEPAEKSAAGFLIRAALTPFVQHNLQ